MVKERAMKSARLLVKEDRCSGEDVSLCDMSQG